jgi:hypothetical protein
MFYPRIARINKGPHHDIGLSIDAVIKMARQGAPIITSRKIALMPDHSREKKALSEAMMGHLQAQ